MNPPSRRIDLFVAVKTKKAQPLPNKSSDKIVHLKTVGVYMKAKITQERKLYFWISSNFYSKWYWFSDKFIETQLVDLEDLNSVILLDGDTNYFLRMSNHLNFRKSRFESTWGCRSTAPPSVRLRCLSFRIVSIIVPFRFQICTQGEYMSESDMHAKFLFLPHRRSQIAKKTADWDYVWYPTKA